MSIGFTPTKLIVMELHVKHIVQTLLDYKQWSLTISQAKEYNFVHKLAQVTDTQDTARQGV